MSSSQRPARIVLVCSDESVLPTVEETLAPFFHITYLNAPKDVLPLHQETAVDAVVLDIDPAEPDAPDGIDVLRQLRAFDADLLLFAITRVRSRQQRLRIHAAGADQVLLAPVDCQELKVKLEQALQDRQQEIERRGLEEQARSRSSFCELIGASDAMRMVYSAISRVADSLTPVVIRGESGTGKELVARAIVATSPRCDRPFISINCAALPETLIEAELFGYEKGAFTDAREPHCGHFEAAQGGTIFLDEISSMGLGLQGKLLRVLEEHTIQRLGSRKTLKVDFRLLTATNDDLEEMVRAGRFREDLYYRINVVPIFLPALREREGDVALLAEHFVRLYCSADGRSLKTLEPDVVEILEEYEWPGNVRELENLIRRLVLMSHGNFIKVKDLPNNLLHYATATQEALLIPAEGIDFDRELENAEVAYLRAALKRTNGNKASAGRLLHVNPQRMKYLCRKHRLGMD
ncbi:MAG TPA: sigma-54 dependent transcriptional regulator [Candidatus Aquilonibacter sp.]|nr:sigma-54 dependent transcriptional regulator [Candidatus Aquilonibacter sp.]